MTNSDSFQGMKILLKCSFSGCRHAVKSPWSKHLIFLFWQQTPPKPSFVFEKCSFSDPWFISYHLGNTQIDYLPKENIALKNSWLPVRLTLGHLLALPPPGWEKTLSVVEWRGLERRRPRWKSFSSLWHPLLLSDAAVSPHQKQGHMLTAKHVPSLKVSEREKTF